MLAPLSRPRHGHAGEQLRSTLLAIAEELEVGADPRAALAPDGLPLASGELVRRILGLGYACSDQLPDQVARAWADHRPAPRTYGALARRLRPLVRP